MGCGNSASLDMSMIKLSKARSVKCAAPKGQSQLLTSRTSLQRTVLRPGRHAERNDVIDAQSSADLRTRARVVDDFGYRPIAWSSRPRKAPAIAEVLRYAASTTTSSAH